MSRSKRIPKVTRTQESARVVIEIPSENAGIETGVSQTRERGRKKEPPSEFLPRVRVGRLRTVEDWLKEFGRHIIIGRARTVTEGADQKGIPDALQYSVLDELLRIEQ
jgi:hypothetical protein